MTRSSFNVWQVGHFHDKKTGMAHRATYARPKQRTPGTGAARKVSTMRIKLLGAIAVGALAVVAAGCGGEGELDQEGIIDKVRPSTLQVLVETADGEAGGTGVVVDADKGYVLTNYHVVAGNDGSLRVRSEEEGEVEAAILGMAPCEDLALLKLDRSLSEIKTIEFGTTEDVKAGDSVTVLGYPGTFQVADEKLTANTGTVSVDGTVAAELGSDYPRYEEVVQHNAAVNHGHSGGPLVDEEGKLIGINTLGNTEEENQSYSVGVDRVQRMIPQLEKGNIAYSGLSLMFIGYSKDEIKAARPELGWTIDTGGIGVLVNSVDPGSPADDASIFVNDYIEKIDGKTINSTEDACNALAANQGEKVEVIGYYMAPTDDEDTNAGDRWRATMTVR
jgi:S1-C subfamily serine protease